MKRKGGVMVKIHAPILRHQTASWPQLQSHVSVCSPAERGVPCEPAAPFAVRGASYGGEKTESDEPEEGASDDELAVLVEAW